MNVIFYCLSSADKPTEYLAPNQIMNEETNVSDFMLNSTLCFDIAAANKRCLLSNKHLSSWLSRI